MMFLKILQYAQENNCMKFLRAPILKNICIQLLLNWLYKVIVWNFVSGSHVKLSRLKVILQNYQSLSNQSFKQNLAYMPFIYLTPMLSCEPRIFMFIINGYYIKSKHLQSLNCLSKDVIIYFYVTWLGRKHCRWNCATATLETIH